MEQIKYFLLLLKFRYPPHSSQYSPYLFLLLIFSFFLSFFLFFFLSFFFGIPFFCFFFSFSFRYLVFIIFLFCSFFIQKQKQKQNKTKTIKKKQELAIKNLQLLKEITQVKVINQLFHKQIVDVSVHISAPLLLLPQRFSVHLFFLFS